MMKMLLTTPDFPKQQRRLCVCVWSRTCGVSDRREQTMEVSLFVNSLSVKHTQYSC